MVLANLLPYANFRLSDALSTAEYNAVGASGAALTGATLTGDNVMVAAQTIDTHQLAQNVRSFAESATAARLDRGSVSSNVLRQRRGRVTWEATVEFYADADTDDTYDVLIKTQAGPRLLYVERATGRILVAVVEVMSVSSSGVDTDGDTVYTAVLANAGLVEPVWE